MNVKQYEKMSKFVDEMNASVSVVGDSSVYLFNRFRVFVGFLFIVVTTVAISFIVAEFVRGFQLAPIYGIDTYYLALGASMIVGAYLAYFGEEAKIAVIKGIIFSIGGNRFWQFIAAVVIITVLILVNTKGVQKIADFSLRYMDNELTTSVVYKLKENKIQTHADLATVRSSVGISDTSIKALQSSREDMIRAKQAEIKAIQNASNNYIQGRDPRAYRTLIARKKVETAQMISTIENKWAKKIAKLDWKIQKAEEKINDRIMSANKLRTQEIEKADQATNELISFYEKNSNDNKKTVKTYKGIGLVVAIAGEIIDGVLAFVLFMIVRTNPNTAGTLEVQQNTREIKTLQNFQGYSSLGTSNKESSAFNLKNEHQPLSNSLFQMIKSQSKNMAIEKNELFNWNGFQYTNHPTQREIIASFKKLGINVTPLHIQEYFSKMGNALIFVNQKVGFVYADFFENAA